MPQFLNKLNYRLAVLLESDSSEAIKTVTDTYNRRAAEDLLFHTIGPLTTEAHYVNKDWYSRAKPPTEAPVDYKPGGPAPQWTPEEVVMAFAGDPNFLFKGKDHPRSPRSGGGAPLYRIAKKIARHYGRDHDSQYLADLYGNGFIPLIKMMQPGFDQLKSPFISYVYRNVQDAMEHGIGGETRTSLAKNVRSQTGAVGVTDLAKETDPEKVRKAASIVKGEFRHKKSHAKNPDNPFGRFSADYYRTATAYADALESENEEEIDRTRNHLMQLHDEIEDYSTLIPGASTGLSQAINTGSRKTGDVSLVSMDAPRKSAEGEEAGMAGNIEGDTDETSFLDPETVEYVLNMALKYDLGEILKNSAKYQKMANDLGAKKGRIGGMITANELRYVIRKMGPLGSNYPGKGVMRKNLNIPRDSKGWWSPGEDPEIEPVIPLLGESEDYDEYDEIWHSAWSRNGYPQMEPLQISQEMTEEVREFKKLDIETARVIKKKGKIEEVVSKTAVSAAVKAATVKLTILSDIHRHELGLENRLVPANMLTEDLTDRLIIAETCDAIIKILLDESPPGWKGSVNAMKKNPKFNADGKDKNKLNPWAIAWSQKNKGATPHYKNKDGKPEKKKQYS